jgi:hypothetical protein
MNEIARGEQGALPMPSPVHYESLPVDPDIEARVRAYIAGRKDGYYDTLTGDQLEMVVACSSRVLGLPHDALIAAAEAFDANAHLHPEAARRPQSLMDRRADAVAMYNGWGQYDDLEDRADHSLRTAMVERLMSVRMSDILGITRDQADRADDVWYEFNVPCDAANLAVDHVCGELMERVLPPAPDQTPPALGV